MNYLAFCARENLCVDWRIELSAITFSTALGTSGTAVACLDARKTSVRPSSGDDELMRQQENQS